jgi:hypothetical protein
MALISSEIFFALPFGSNLYLDSLSVARFYFNGFFFDASQYILRSRLRNKLTNPAMKKEIEGLIKGFYPFKL